MHSRQGGMNVSKEKRGSGVLSRQVKEILREGEDRSSLCGARGPLRLAGAQEGRRYLSCFLGAEGSGEVQCCRCTLKPTPVRILLPLFSTRTSLGQLFNLCVPQFLLTSVG